MTRNDALRLRLVSVSAGTEVIPSAAFSGKPLHSEFLDAFLLEI